MKKSLILAFAVISFFACSKDEIPTKTDQYAESAAIIRINVQGGAYNRSVEGGHNGGDNTQVAPKVYSVTVQAYNDSHTLLSEIDLSYDEMKNAIKAGSTIPPQLVNPDGSTTAAIPDPAGAKVGLPIGTRYVDVVLNRPSGTNAAGVTNINYFNYDKDVLDNGSTLGDQSTAADDNFDRVYLVSQYAGTGTQLTNLQQETKPGDVPVYKMDFQVAPALARMEIIKGIPVADAETWTDAYKRTWKKMTLNDFKTQIGKSYTTITETTQPDATSATPGDIILYNNAFYICKTINNNNKWVTYKGAVYDAVFDNTTVFFPEGYWYEAGTSSGITGTYDSGKATTEDAVDAGSGTSGNAGWVTSDLSGTVVTWYPNQYYAIDIEAIYINNVKVRAANLGAYMVPWPGNGDATNNWPTWHKYYHDDGWHVAGSSADNSFLCMGNMWDRIATSDTKVEVTVPGITPETGASPGGTRKMQLAGSKLKVETGVSQYWGTNKDLGITNGKASAFQIYAQELTKIAPSADDVASGMPHVILKVKAYKSKVEYDNGKNGVASKEFLTIRRFKQTDDSYLTKIQSAYIYRIDLTNLKSSFVGDVPVPGGKHPDTVIPKDPLDPDPEMPNSQLDVTVSVLPWTIADITPDV